MKGYQMITKRHTNQKDVKGLVEFLVKSLVDQPDETSIVEVQNEEALVIEVSVAKDDMGKIIGKHGRIARALRVVTKSMAARDGRKVMIDIVD